MSGSVAQCASTTRNSRLESRRRRRSDGDKIFGQFDARASTRLRMVAARSQRMRSAVAAPYERRNSRKGDLQIAPAVLETAAPCFDGGHRPPLQPYTPAARR